MMHDQLEKYLKEDVSLDYSVADPYGVYPAEVASTGLQYLPKPKSSGLHVEKYFRFEVPKLSPEDPTIYVRGYKDYFIEPEHREDGLPHVGDHKSCGNWQYALTADDLQQDPQAIIYAWDELQKHPSAQAVSLQWTYYGTKKPYRAMPVMATVTREHVTQLIDEIFVSSRELVATYRARPAVLSLPFNADECPKYSRDGCHYQQYCKLSPRERRPFAMPDVTTETLIDRINARKTDMTAPAAPAPGGLTPFQAKLAAAKAAKAAQASALTTPAEESGAMPPAAQQELFNEDKLPTGRKATPMPATDQPINCPEDYQPPPATASTPVEVAPELAAAVAPKGGKGRPKGSKNAPAAVAAPEGIDVAALNAYLVASTELVNMLIAECKAAKQ